jgi:LmbE family N-acetylglucosaminyl deacetylase
MLSLKLASSGETLSVLCIGAHSDDIEIGAGATLLGWIANGWRLDIHWAVLSARHQRADEAYASATAFCEGARHLTIDLAEFTDGFFPYEGQRIKSWFEALKSKCAPDIIFCHWRDDAHQDHREVSKLTWNTFRDHLILEYEIPKWDGDLGRPNLYMACSAEIIRRKTALLGQHFGSQASKDWFQSDTFTALARLRGIECRAAEGFAEGFYARKLTIG